MIFIEKRYWNYRFILSWVSKRSSTVVRPRVYDADITHWRIDRHAPNVQRKLTKTYTLCTRMKNALVIVRRSLHKFEVRRKANVYDW